MAPDNCAGCTIAGDASLKGYPAIALNHGTIRVKDFMAHFGIEKWLEFKQPKSIMYLMNKLEDGATGVIYGYRGKNIDGHYFNVVKKNGMVLFIDFQAEVGERVLNPATIMKSEGYKELLFFNTTSIR